MKIIDITIIISFPILTVLAMIASDWPNAAAMAGVAWAITRIRGW